MHVCPVLMLLISCQQHVSYTNIKRWWKFQNATQFLWRAALLFLIFQLKINKDRELDHQWNWAYFSTNLFNKINITMPELSVWSVLFNQFFCQPISHAQLNWTSDRKLEKLASSTWSLGAIVLYQLFMRFSEWRIWISLLIDSSSIHRKYTLSHLINT